MEDSRGVIFWVIVIFMILFFIAFIVMLVLFFVQRSKLINPDSCPACTPTGNYVVLPGTGGTINRCGDNLCAFRAQTLTEAIRICDQQASICDQFTWTEGSATVSFISTSAPDPTLNLYVRQTGTA